MEQQPNTVWVRGYTADGYQVSVALTIGSVADVASRLQEIRDAGILPNAPGLAAAEEKETIAAVIRREKPSDGTPIIDFYPVWNTAGTFGAHKYAHMYLDTADDVREFEAQTGLRLQDIPVYDGQQAIKRTHGRVHKCEVQVNRPFEIVREKVGEHETGMPKYAYRYFAPAAPSTPEPTQVRVSDTAQALGATITKQTRKPAKTMTRQQFIDKMASIHVEGAEITAYLKDIGVKGGADYDRIWADVEAYRMDNAA